MRRRGVLLTAGLLLALVPATVRAEVSVIVDGHGRVRRVVYITKEGTRTSVVWKQVRPRVPLDELLNPLGDTTGDLAPTIAVHPQTGRPWVVWPRNEGNQKRLVYSVWEGKGWTPAQPVAAPDIMGWDQVEPRLLFDPEGTPYLLFTEASRKARILFTTLSRKGGWTPPLALTDGTVDSRGPLAALLGTDLKVSWTTPTGTVTQLLPAASLLESATNLMDSPIPPGSSTAPDQPPPPDDPGGEPISKHKHK
jgi:hypothetical protein